MDLLLRLSNALGPSGREKEVRDLVMKEIKPHVDKMFIDKFGNLICHKKGKGPRIMLSAHMDEVGLMVKEIRGNGRIHFDTLGSIEPITLVGQGVFIMTKKGIVNGVITFAEIHEDAEVEELPYLEDLYVDTGLIKEDLEKLGLEIGDYIIATHKSRYLGSRNIISGKALDDRIGCYTLIEVAKKIKKTKADIYFVFTVQEEIGLYGAQTSVYHIDPDYGIAVDVTYSPDAKESPHLRMGWGAVITYKDAEILPNKCLNDYLKELALKNKIPIQFEVTDVGSTDATKIMLSKGGIPTTIVSVPVRNIHSTISIAHREDIENSIKLLVELLKKPLIKCEV